jgi:integrase
VSSIKLTKQVVLETAPGPHFIKFDSVVPGFGLRSYPSGKKSWIFQYRPGEGGRRAPLRRYVIGDATSISPAVARKEAERIRAVVMMGGDPQRDLIERRQALSVADLASEFLTQHVEPKRAASTKRYYEDLLERFVIPAFGRVKARDLKPADVARLHHGLRSRPFLANRILAVIGAMYSFGEGPTQLVPKGTNPVVDIERYEEPKRERLLSSDELTRLGSTLRDAQTKGIPWNVRPSAKTKHLRKDAEKQATVVAPAAIAAIRLLLFTGARLREILHLRWDQVDLERGLVVVSQHKTSRRTGTKTIVLNSPALEVLKSIERSGIHVIAGESAGRPNEKPRSDLKRPWAMITKHAGLDGLRIHDLRHNFASFGVGGGTGLPIVGKLLGHTQAATTQRYSHLDSDPLRRASESIGAAIASALVERSV